METMRSFCPSCGMRSAELGECARGCGTLVEMTESSSLGMEVGNYVIVRALGEGGMGTVYRAVQPVIGAVVAIKVLHASSEAHAKRFLLEAQTVNRVRHPNLIRIVDTGFLGDRRPYLVMELLDGLSLADTVGKLGPMLACHVTAEALDALEAVHDVGVVHRDLKPANVFVTREGRVVVLDFGIAKVVDGNGPMTNSSALIGTPEYMAPEQIRSAPLDRRSDVYAMGVLLYETLTGKRPFAAAATFEMLVQHLERPPTSPRDYVPDLAPAIADAVLRALEKDPANRFQRASDMAEALRAAIDTTDAPDQLAAYIEAHAPVPSSSSLPSTAPSTREERPQGSQPAPTTPLRGSRERDQATASTRDERPSSVRDSDAPATASPPTRPDNEPATVGDRPVAAVSGPARKSRFVIAGAAVVAVVGAATFVMTSGGERSAEPRTEQTHATGGVPTPLPPLDAAVKRSVVEGKAAPKPAPKPEPDAIKPRPPIVEATPTIRRGRGKGSAGKTVPSNAGTSSTNTATPTTTTPPTETPHATPDPPRPGKGSSHRKPNPYD